MICLGNIQRYQGVGAACKLEINVRCYQHVSVQIYGPPSTAGGEGEQKQKDKVRGFSPLYLIDFKFFRKIWHLSGDVTANNKVFVFRNIIL